MYRKAELENEQNKSAPVDGWVYVRKRVGNAPTSHHARKLQFVQIIWFIKLLCRILVRCQFCNSYRLEIFIEVTTREQLKQ